MSSGKIRFDAAQEKKKKKKKKKKKRTHASAQMLTFVEDMSFHDDGTFFCNDTGTCRC